MEPFELREVREGKRRQLLKLIEVSDLTEELAEAMKRGDQVSVRMLISMRQTPLSQAEEIERNIQRHLLAQPPETAIRLNELLKGDPARTPEEEPLCQQVEQTRRMLKKVVELDRRISVRFGGSHSFYKMFREQS